MIQSGTFLRVVDNSGVKYAKCLRVVTPSTKGSGNVGDVVVVSVKMVQKKKKLTSKIKKGDVVLGIVVSTQGSHNKFDSQRVSFFSNSIVLVNKSLKPLGNRVVGPVLKSLRQMRVFKLVSMSSGSI